MDLTATLNQVQSIMEKGEEFKKLLEKYAVKVDKYDDFIFSALGLVASLPGVPITWRASIAIIQQFEKSSLSYLLKAVGTSENVTQAKSEDKLALAVSSIVNSTATVPVPVIQAVMEEKKVEPVSKVFQIVPAITETVQSIQAVVSPEEEKKDGKVEPSKVKEILKVANEVNSFVGLINSFIKGR